ncbi:hypothetical protein [Ferrimonas balearica]|uniref:hypothetical protein n=1 Tax=Ferrimonas balearica TaxID=44012 RepID=UPI001C96D7C8|nr:hypothetical protein [Ferrimonas balearica]MBY6223159.1 hypothetical protein [Ferrimonas balearica]
MYQSIDRAQVPEHLIELYDAHQICTDVHVYEPPKGDAAHYMYEDSFIRPHFVDLPDVQALVEDGLQYGDINALKQWFEAVAGTWFETLHCTACNQMDVTLDYTDDSSGSCHYHVRDRTIRINEATVADALRSVEGLEALLYNLVHEIGHHIADHLLISLKHDHQFHYGLLIVLNTLFGLKTTLLYEQQREILYRRHRVFGELSCNWDEMELEHGYFARALPEHIYEIPHNGDFAAAIDVVNRRFGLRYTLTDQEFDRIVGSPIIENEFDPAVHGVFFIYYCAPDTTCRTDVEAVADLDLLISITPWHHDTVRIFVQHPKTYKTYCVERYLSFLQQQYDRL